MSILISEQAKQVQASSIRFVDDMLVLELSDGRRVWLPFQKIRWLRWLAQATPEQREKWEILPQGFGVYWDELDDGFEVEHALSLTPLTHTQ